MRNRCLFNDIILSESSIVKYLALHLAYVMLLLVVLREGLGRLSMQISNNYQ